jgi:hypothetical protein
MSEKHPYLELAESATPEEMLDAIRSTSGVGAVGFFVASDDEHYEVAFVRRDSDRQVWIDEWGREFESLDAALFHIGFADQIAAALEDKGP